MDFYLGKENYLVLMQESRMVIEGNEMLTKTYMSDFREADGMTMPYSVETKMGGQVMSLLKFTTVAVNKDVDDSVFAKPVDVSIKK